MTNNEWNREPPQYKYGDDPSKPPPQEGFADWGSSNMYTGGPAVGAYDPGFTNRVILPGRRITPWGVIKWILVFGVALFLILTIVAVVLGFIAGMETSLK